MPTFLMIGRHDPIDCAMHNEKSAKILAQWSSKLPELLAKHNIKMEGGWVVHPEHLAVVAYTAPSFEAMEAFSMEPENMAMAHWQSVELKPAMTLEESGQMIQQLMQQKRA